MGYKFDCRLFTGYKPCIHKRPCDGCDQYQPVKQRLAIVSLEALGAVLRSTCLLPPLKRKYPDSHITWITYKSASNLLKHNPYIDRVIELDGNTSHLVQYLKFDAVFAVDKSIEAGSLAQTLNAKERFGFGLNTDGVIVPLNPEASYQYDVGLSDELKFFINEKPETQQITESMNLEWKRDPYILEKTPDEEAIVKQRRAELLQGKKGVIGYNTGCSLLFPYKKFTVEHSIDVIRMWRKQHPDWVVALLGGREDSERQTAMKEAFKNDPYVVNTPTTEGLRSGILWMDATDLVLSGCSLGLHIAIGLKKPVICWFGVSCAQEIDTYDRGVKIKADVSCAPCWKKSCNNEPKCYNRVSTTEIEKATSTLMKNHFYSRI